jgi:hypothetical protein
MMDRLFCRISNAERSSGTCAVSEHQAVLHTVVDRAGAALVVKWNDKSRAPHREKTRQLDPNPINASHQTR